MTKPDFSEVWENLVREPLVNCHPDSNPCDHGKYAVCVQCLQRIFDKHPDWDGYGANAVNAESFWRAKSFVENLPNDVEKPELVPEPDGDVVLVWTKDGRHVCIVGIKPTGRMVVSIFKMGHINHLIGSKYALYAFLQAAYRE